MKKFLRLSLLALLLTSTIARAHDDVDAGDVGTKLYHVTAYSYGTKMGEWHNLRIVWTFSDRIVPEPAAIEKFLTSDGGIIYFSGNFICEPEAQK